ncbi:MAG: DUF2214 family protein [Moraxellaceae bacterium]|nr:DUF2214 family protein [Moraxellaceae bacterium]
MITPALMASLHHLLFFIIIASLVAELILLARPIDAALAKRLARIDMHYGISAMAVLAVGFMRVFMYEKGEAFYFGNAFFHLKIGIFAVVGIASIYPTVLLMRWYRAFRSGQTPDTRRAPLLRKLVIVELVGVGLMLVCAALMARGVGMFR